MTSSPAINPQRPAHFRGAPDDIRARLLQLRDERDERDKDCQA